MFQISNTATVGHDSMRDKLLSVNTYSLNNLYTPEGATTALENGQHIETLTNLIS